MGGEGKKSRNTKAAGEREIPVEMKKTVLRKRNGSSSAESFRNGEISPEHYYRMVSEAAYFIACHRNFVGGNSEDDWFEAERKIRTLK